MQNSPLRLGVLGFANIAQGAIVPAAGQSETVEVTAVATRGGAKAGQAPGTRARRRTLRGL